MGTASTSCGVDVGFVERVLAGRPATVLVTVTVLVAPPQPAAAALNAIMAVVTATRLRIPLMLWLAPAFDKGSRPAGGVSHSKGYRTVGTVGWPDLSDMSSLRHVAWSRSWLLP